MSLYKELNAIVERYKGDLLLIRKFVNSTLEGLDNARKIVERHKDNITDEDLKALLAVARALKETANETLTRRANNLPRGRKKNWGKTIKTTARANEIILKTASGIKSKGFLAEMALSYIISFQEGFTKDYLEEVLSNRPELLKSGKSLSFEDAVRFSSIATLRRHLARSETDALGYGSIDDLATYLQRKFNILIQEEPFWPSVREAIYRRNLIIHNKGFVNEIYRAKINNRTGSKLETDSSM
jgi:hypothetical protein